MKSIILLPFLLLAACATTHRTIPPSTTPAVRSIQTASAGTIRAQASAQKTRVAIRTASDAVAVLDRTATTEQKPAVATIKESLTVAQVQIEQTEARLLEVSSALVKSDAQLTTLQGQVDELATDRDKQASDAREYATAYHRLKFKAGALAAALAGYLVYAFCFFLPLPYRIAATAAGGLSGFGLLWIIV